MPPQKPGQSEQTVQTPRDFMDAVVGLFGAMTFDLAATSDNAQCERFFSAADDSLKQDWTALDGNLWLNPPYENIDPWAAKCALSSPPGQVDRRIFLLVPASVGSAWFAMHVHEKALVLAFRPRLKFVGHSKSYPKDCALAVFGEPPAFETWRWRRAHHPRAAQRLHRAQCPDLAAPTVPRPH
jgi:site-specific DNA-methyltransferase (adenine-specific)